MELRSYFKFIFKPHSTSSKLIIFTSARWSSAETCRESFSPAVKFACWRNQGAGQPFVSYQTFTLNIKKIKFSSINSSFIKTDYNCVCMYYHYIVHVSVLGFTDKINGVFRLD